MRVTGNEIQNFLFGTRGCKGWLPCCCAASGLAVFCSLPTLGFLQCHKSQGSLAIALQGAVSGRDMDFWQYLSIVKVRLLFFSPSSSHFRCARALPLSLSTSPYLLSNLLASLYFLRALSLSLFTKHRGPCCSPSTSVQLKEAVVRLFCL